VAGGAETYLRQIIPGLREQGHQIAFAHEVEAPEGRESIAATDPALTWCIARSGVPAVLHNLSAWRPDVLFVHGLTQHDWLLEIVKTVPAVFFCHDYAGICISGTKTFRALEARSCSRAFGWQCLVHYYPCHCGGWNPVTMWREYDRQSERLKLLRLGQAIVTASSAVRQEYLRNGFAPERVHLAPLMPNCEIAPSLTGNPRDHPGHNAPWQLLFAGRMEWMKGGDILLDTLPIASAALDRPLQVTFSGDGTCRDQWERKAALLQSERLRIEFTGWQDAGALQAILDRTHLLVFPSVWPEPFGLVGLEAGCRGVPVAAFSKGGIPDWLKDGVNGYMAPANPPRARGLADAIVKCLADADTYQRLRSGAVQIARQFTLARHIQALNGIFNQVLERKAA
jgi:glycosyltransferase involved in cell wall biosynthesis